MSGGATSRMIDMANRRDAKLEALIQALDRNTAANQGGGGSGGSGLGGGGATPGSGNAQGNNGRAGGRGGEAWERAWAAAHSENEKRTGFIGPMNEERGHRDGSEYQAHAENAARARQTGLAGFLGSIPTPAPYIASAIGAAGYNVIGAYSNRNQGALGAYANAPTSDTGTMAKQRAQIAWAQGQMDAQNVQDTFTHPFTKGQREVARAQGLRAEVQGISDSLDPEVRTQARLRQIFGGSAAARGADFGGGLMGRLNGNADIRMVDKMHDYIRKQEDGRQELDKVLRDHDKRATAGAAGQNVIRGQH